MKEESINKEKGFQFNKTTLWIVIIAIIAIIVAWVLHREKQAVKEELTESKSRAERRYLKLKGLIASRERLQKKINSTIRKLEIISRFLFLSILAILLWFWHEPKDSELLEHTMFHLGVMATFIAVVAYVFTGKPFGVMELSNAVPHRIKSMFWSKYVSLDQKIELNKQLAEECKTSIVQLKAKLQVL